MILSETVSPDRRVASLSSEELRRAAPSIFAECARPGVSSRYTFVSTASVVTLLQSQGWEPVRVREQRVRLEDRRGFQMHEVRFARRDDLDLHRFAVGQCRPEMILRNAHDGTGAYRIDAGLYRLVCRNGLTVADAAFASVSIRHVDLAPERFLAAAQSVGENAPRVLAVIARWKSVRLTSEGREAFARRALALRWNREETVGRLLNTDSLLHARRVEDREPDLWTTFNTVQEHLVRGGDRYAGVVARANESVRRFVRNTTRPVGGISEEQRLNKQLWALAEEFSRN